VPIRTSPASSACSPQARARRITGTNPAHDTRFGSSKRAWARDELCNNRIYEVPYPLGFWKLANSHHPSSEALYLVSESCPPGCGPLRAVTRIRVTASLAFARRDRGARSVRGRSGSARR
jgi:hypothetical protein